MSLLLRRLSLLTAALLTTWFIVTFLYFPNANVLIALVADRPDGIGATASDLFGSQRVRNAIRDTVIVAAASVITVNIVGIAQVIFIEAIELRGRALLKVAYAIPLVFGSVSAVSGYWMVYGTHGFLTRALQSVFPGLSDTWFSGMFAVIFVHTFTMTGYHFLFLRPAIRRIDFSMIEAARSLGVSPTKTLALVALPILRPTILAALLMVMIGALGSFAAPDILGGGDFTMVGPLVLALTKLDRPDMAAMLGLMLAIATIGLLIWALAAERKAVNFAPNKSAQPFRRVPISNPLLRTLAYAFAYLLALLNIAPLAITLLMSLSPPQAIRTTSFDGFTLAHYRAVFSDSESLRPFLNSLILCAIAIFAVLAIGAFCTHLLARARSRAADALQISLFLPYFLSGVLIALGFLIAFDAPSLLVANNVLVGSFWILPAAYCVILLPTCVRFLRSTYAGMDPALDDAARSLGAGPGRRYLFVTLPVLAPVILQVAALSFNLVFDEYPVSVMLYDVRNQPIGVAMGSLASSNNPDLVGVTTTYVILATLIGMLVVLFADRMAGRASARATGMGL